MTSTFKDVLDEEWKEIKQGRENVKEAESRGDSAKTAQPSEGALDTKSQSDSVKADQANEIDEPRNLVGLALSGGGIRSATFNLGVIQALAKNGLLSKFDYLSTVSGGGYIGSWLVSWAYRKERENKGTPEQDKSQNPPVNGITQIQKILKENCDSSSNNIPSPEPGAVAWLRRYSNYLTPRKGLFSLDTLTGITYHIRNVFLSTLTTALFVFGLMALLAGIIKSPGNLHDIANNTHAGFVSFAGLAMGFIAAAWLWFRLPLVAGEMPTNKTISMGGMTYRGNKWAVRIIALLVVIHSVILGVVGISPSLSNVKLEPIFYYPDGLGLGVGYFVAALLGIISSHIFISVFKKASVNVNWLRLYFTLPFGAVPFFILGGFLHKITFSLCLMTSWELTGISAPLTCLLVSFAASVHLGAVGRAISSEAYFWVSRVAGKMVHFSILFAFPAIAFLVFPTLFDWTEAILSIGGISAAYAIIARWLAASPSTGGSNGNKDKWQRKVSEGVVFTAPFILILVLVGFAALGVRNASVGAENFFDSNILKDQRCVCQEKTNISDDATTIRPKTKNNHTEEGDVQLCLHEVQSKIASSCTPSLLDFYKRNINTLNSMDVISLRLFGSVALIMAIILAWLIDANLFSLHSYYRNRLTNAYLAASNTRKDRDADIGVHHSDAIPLQGLANVKPYLLVNTTLNLSGKNTDLAWQDRKAASFVMSPLYCGYAIESMSDGHNDYFMPTSDFAKKNNSIPSPIKLSLPMTISGAAGSPLGGFHTKPGISMLLALAGVRLGWWLPNPAKPAAWMGKPDTSLLATFPDEMLGDADENEDVVYLSDGGHFENLGIYELVRRRCALIVASDASADPDFVFDDLARAIHNIRTDFGVEVEIDITPLRPQKNSAESEAKYRFSPSNFVVGAIKYYTSPIKAFQESESRIGHLIYIKSSIAKSAKKDAVDVLYYASTHENFPHEPTSDQWFSEEQFEAYRKLGLLVGEDAAVSIDDLIRKLSA
jgi:hypothetical protein